MEAGKYPRGEGDQLERSGYFEREKKRLAHQSVIRHVRRSLNFPDIVHRGHRRRESSVNAEDLGSDDRGDGEGVEDVD